MATTTRSTPSGTASVPGRKGNGMAWWITVPQTSEVRYTSGGRTRPRFATSRAALEASPSCGLVVMVSCPAILLCHSLNCPRLLFVALMAQWHYSLITDKLTATLQVAKRVYSLAQQQNDSAIIMVLAGQALDEVRRELGRDGVSDFQRRAMELARNAWNLSEERQEQRKNLCRQYTK